MIQAKDRSTFTTTIDKKMQKEFKIKCMQNDKKMNDVLEKFMQNYISDTVDYKIEK